MHSSTGHAETKTHSFFLHDILLLAASASVAVLFVRTDTLAGVLDSMQYVQVLGSFIAGIFFTSVFTTAPAIVTLGKLSLMSPILSVAFFGALGAVVGDLIIFWFIRDRFSEHLMELLNHQQIGKRMHALLKLKLFRWVSFFVGGLIIASPLPDEIGISLIGFSKMKTSWFLLLSFFFNFWGILFIGLFARALL